jgi:hypothetical protein
LTSGQDLLSANHYIPAYYRILQALTGKVPHYDRTSSTPQCLNFRLVKLRTSTTSLTTNSREPVRNAPRGIVNIPGQMQRSRLSQTSHRSAQQFNSRSKSNTLNPGSYRSRDSCSYIRRGADARDLDLDLRVEGQRPEAGMRM